MHYIDVVALQVKVVKMVELIVESSKRAASFTCWHFIDS